MHAMISNLRNVSNFDIQLVFIFSLVANVRVLLLHPLTNKADR